MTNTEGLAIGDDLDQDYELDASAFRFSIVPEALNIDPDVTDNGERVFTRLLRYGASTGARFPGYGRLASDLHRSKATVKRAVRNLEESGWLTRIERPGRSNLFVLHSRKCRPGEVRSDLGGGGQICTGRGVKSDLGGGVKSEPLPIASITESNLRESVNADASTRRTSRKRQPQAPTLPGMSPTSGRRDDPPEKAEARQLADYLADKIAANTDGVRPKVTKAWVNTVDRILRIDERSPDQVRAAIDWVHTNPAGEFWIANIRSPEALRRQYGRLQAEAKRQQRAASGQRETYAEMTQRVMAEVLGS